MTAAPPRAAPGRLYGIQGLRGLAVLMVFSIHLFEVERTYSKGPLLLGPWIHVNVFGLDIFLVISGFVITMLGFGHFTSREYIKSYAFNRITRVYPIYMIYTAPLAFVFLFRPEFFNASEGNQVSLWRSMLLIPDVTLPLIPVAWTLHHELYFYLVIGLLLFFPERRFPRGIAVWFVLTTVMVLAAWDVPRNEKGAFEKVLTNPLNYDFIFGMTAAWLVRTGVTRGPWWCMAIGTIGAVAGYAIYYMLTGLDRVDDRWAVVIFGLPAALVTYSVVVLEQRQGWVFARCLGWVGDAAYSLYLTHVMSIVLVGRLWGHVGVPGWPSHLVFMAVATTFGLWVGWMAYQKVEKPLIARLRKFDPARRQGAAT